MTQHIKAMEYSGDDYARAWKTYQDRVNLRDMFIQSLPRIKDELPGLSNIKSIVFISGGFGRLELDFVGLYGCLENVTEMASVEPDAEQMAKFKKRVSQLFPTVRTVCYQEKFEDWKGTDKPYDAVTLFDCLYHNTLAEYSVLFKKLFDNVVASGGYVFFLMSPYDVTYPITSFGRVMKRLKISTPDPIEVPVIREMMIETGFESCYDLPVHCKMNCENLNDDFARLFVFLSEGKVTLEDAREVVEEEFGGRKSDPYKMNFLAFRKP